MQRVVRPLTTALAVVLVFVSLVASAQDIPLHYYNGKIRVDLVASPNEVAVIADKGEQVGLQGLAGLAPAAQTNLSRNGNIAVMSFSGPAATRADIAARGKGLQGLGGSVVAVAYLREGRRNADDRIFIPRRFSLQPKPGVRMGDLAQSYGLRVVEEVSFARNTYIVEPISTDLFAGLDAANAIFEGGQARFATPLVRHQQAKRLIPNDPFFTQQWHLRNTGQPSGGVAGNDVNITGAWDTVTGDGVNIAITDSGVQWFHVDLTDNARTDIDIDINDGDNDPAPQFDSHGTSCAGMAAGVGQNSIGITGAAFEAGIVGIRLIEGPSSDLDEANAMNHQANESNPANYVHINSNSWGPSDNGQNLTTFGPLTEAAFINGVTNGRGGRGIVYVWAGGNGRQSNDNANYDGYASSRYTIAVGATGSNGVVSYYSESGASLLVNAPSSYSGGGTTTTDFMNGGDLGSHYTSGFGGTSSAAPLVAGVVALVLEANPTLSWRDVQHILVNTATRNDPGNAGWLENGAGFFFNHSYGFGRVNATAAVAAAQGWSNLPDAVMPVSETQNVGLAIPDNNSTGVSSNIVVSGVDPSFFTEHVEVHFTAAHTARGQLQVVLTAPSGYQSVLANTRADLNDNYVDWMFTSVAHWGEDPNGTWTLTVRDLTNGQTGIFNSWSLDIHGYFTNPFIGDQDQDLLLDIYEDDTGFFLDDTHTGTDPNFMDTDGDGVIDGTEVELGTDPNNPFDFPLLPAVTPWGLATLAGAILLVSGIALKRNKRFS